MNGVIFDIKEFSIHDGPGLRTTVFMKGCPLRCIWCHNPEGLSAKPQLMYKKNACNHCGLCRQKCLHSECEPFGYCVHICPKGLRTIAGKTITSQQLAEHLIKQSNYWGDEGGVTFSGGEPLMQADFLLDVLNYMGNISVVLETSGYCEPDVFLKIALQMKLVYLDVKLADNIEHIKYTGVSNRKILENLQQIKDYKIPCVVRTPLIPGITDTNENLSSIRKITNGLDWEILPYNPMSGVKYEYLDMEFKYDKYKKCLQPNNYNNVKV